MSICIDYLSHAQVNLQSVELAPVSAEELRGQQTAHSGTAGWAAGQSSAQQAAETQALQRRSPPSAPSLHDWSAPQRQLSAETPFDFQDAATGSRRAPQQGQHGSTQAKRPMSLDQRVSYHLQALVSPLSDLWRTHMQPRILLGHAATQCMAEESSNASV